MRIATQLEPIPRKTLMRFALRFMANLTDGKDGAFEDKVMYGLLSLSLEG